MILITGCAGFIGFHLSKKLLEKKIQVVGIDSINDYYSKNLKLKRLNLLKKYKNFFFGKIDLKNYEKAHEFLKYKKIKQIIHLAAQPGVRISLAKPYNTLNQNLNTFINILEITRIKKIKKFIYASSSSIYGNTKLYPFNELDLKNSPVSVYGATKLSNEIIAQSYSRNFGMKCVGLRFFTVYGPYGRPDMAYYDFSNKLKNNKKIFVFNKGKMLRDFTYIDDVIKGILNVMRKNFKDNHEVINIGKGKPDNLMDMIKYLEKNYKKKFRIKFTNNIPVGDMKKTYSNVNKAKRLINWNPKTTLKTGLEKFVIWFKKNND